MKATILDVKRFEMHDGDGMRTTLFLKGCPLRCKWCHNPESFTATPQLAFYAGKCVNCGSCSLVCERGAHKTAEAKHVFLPDKCVGCGKCVAVCPQNALKLFGMRMDAKEAAAKLLEDRDFYAATGGGVTVSGGEPLMQADFCAELFSILKAENINCALDTSLFANRSEIDKVLPYTDTFLVDIKAVDEKTHERCTGRSNALILSNLRYVDSAGKNIEIRIPYVPGYNESTATDAIDILLSLGHLKGVRILPYHDFASAKYAALGMKFERIALPSKEEILKTERILEERGINIIRY